MIKPDDIRVETEDHPSGRGVMIRAELQATVSRHALDAEWMAYEKAVCQRQLWHGLYGDIEDALLRMRHEVLYGVNTASGPFGDMAMQQANEAIGKVLAMVSNPFCEKFVPKHHPEFGERHPDKVKWITENTP